MDRYADKCLIKHQIFSSVREVYQSKINRVLFTAQKDASSKQVELSSTVMQAPERMYLPLKLSFSKFYLGHSGLLN